jgi:hypothetical protein
MKTGIIFLFVDSDCKTQSSNQWSADPHHPDPPFTLVSIRIRIIPFNFMQIRNQILPLTLFTDLDPPTQCSRMTPSGFHRFTLMRIPFHFDADPDPQYCLLAQFFCPYVTSRKTFGEDCWLYENNLQWD